MGGAGIQCGSAGIAFARASSARSRVFNAFMMLKFVSFGCKGVTRGYSRNEPRGPRGV